MGWLFTNGATKQDVIAELTRSYVTNRGKADIIAYTVIDNVIWKVIDHSDTQSGDCLRYIACDLLESSDSGWGYKSLDESVHPLYYNCPLEYLDMVPDVMCEDWREGVRLYHQQNPSHTA